MNKKLDAIGGNSSRITLGKLGVPQREITLTNGETLAIYDTAGPQGYPVEDGLPKGRA